MNKRPNNRSATGRPAPTPVVFVKPASGPDGPLVVRDPATRKPLPADGAEVPRTGHWLRRLAAGDVVETAGVGPGRPAATKEANPEPEPKKKET